MHMFRLVVVRYTSISPIVFPYHFIDTELKNDKIVHESEAVMKTTGKKYHKSIL